MLERRLDACRNTEQGLGLGSAEFRSIFGAVSFASRIDQVLPAMKQANLSWIRLAEIRWSDVEPVEGQRNWGALSQFEHAALELHANGITPVAIIHFLPTWASILPGSQCAPPAPDKIAAFADFTKALVTRYGGEPYGIKYWEIWNEPDIPRTTSAGSPGCFADPNAADQGGAYYAQILQAVHAAIKGVDPTAKVVLGGLMLGCATDLSGGGASCDPTKGTLPFFDGVLAGGGGSAFDIVAFHAYSYWWGTTTRKDWDGEVPGWTGGVTLGKLAYLRQTMKNHGVADKPVLLDETALLCHENNPACVATPVSADPPAFMEDQANHLVRLYTRAWANGIAGVSWFTLEASYWRRSGLLDTAGQPKPAYRALSFLSNLLGRARFLASDNTGTLEHYEFCDGTTAYHVLWTNTDVATSYSPPARTSAIYDRYGAKSAIAPTISVGFDPVIVEAPNSCFEVYFPFVPNGGSP